MLTWVLERAPFTTQCVASRTAVFISLFVPFEIVLLKSSVLAFRLVSHGNMGLDGCLLDHGMAADELTNAMRHGSSKISVFCVTPLRFRLMTIYRRNIVKNLLANFIDEHKIDIK
jgi:hypothetical protein